MECDAARPPRHSKLGDPRSGLEYTRAHFTVQPPQLLSSNCSLLEAQSEALVPRRKLGSTLRQTCRGRAAKDAGMLLHDRALCVLYERAGAAARKGRGV